MKIFSKKWILLKYIFVDGKPDAPILLSGSYKRI